MKILGLIGGTSWHSTIEYYRCINQAVNDNFGNNTNPPLVLYNVNQCAVHALQRSGDWAAIGEIFSEAAKRLQNAGVEGLMFCANTPHKVFETVADTVDVPMIHICDATAKVIRAESISKVGLIGTRFTMNESFMVDRFANNGIEVIVPESNAEINEIHRVIQEELTFGKIRPKSKLFVRQVVGAMVGRGAQGIILGCTEFPLMFAEADMDVRTFNTTEIHAKAATEFILDN